MTHTTTTTAPVTFDRAEAKAADQELYDAMLVVADKDARRAATPTRS